MSVDTYVRMYERTKANSINKLLYSRMHHFPNINTTLSGFQLLNYVKKTIVAGLIIDSALVKITK